MPPRKTAAEPSAKKPARRASSTQKYVRNLYNSSARIRLTGGDELLLRPRGQRGDLLPLSKEQEKDSKVLLNLGILIEILSEAEAARVIHAQSTNQQAYHPALQVLRDAYGNEYDQTDIRVEADPQTVGDTVAYVEDGAIVRAGADLPRPARSVGPNVSSDFPGADKEMPGLLGADDAARSGQSLVDVLHGFDVG
jgi:hypothetical protein